MKNSVFILILGLLFIGCGSEPQISKEPVKGRTDLKKQSETVAAHTLDKEKQAKAVSTIQPVKPVEKSNKKTKWTRSGNPIDVSEFNAEIAKAEKELKAKPNDDDAKKNLSKALTKRGVALTDARQYASAIGDYRKALKLDSENAEAKKWIAMITNIYKSINRDVPEEGEEPKPLEFKKEKA